MAVHCFFLVRRAVDALLGFLLVSVFGSVPSLSAAWKAFCDLPELSKIGAITVLVILGSVLFEATRGLVARVATRLFKRSK